MPVRKLDFRLGSVDCRSLEGYRKTDRSVLNLIVIRIIIYIPAIIIRVHAQFVEYSFRHPQLIIVAL